VSEVGALAQRHPLVLGSASPRRRELLEQLGVRFSLLPSHIEEPPPGREAPEAYARGLAERKARASAALLTAEQRGAFVLGADTIVVIDERVLNKPDDDLEAQRMLLALQGRSHVVITAVCLVGAEPSFARTIAVSSRVTFRALDAEAAARYVASGEGRDKAGSYAVQGLGAGLVRAIDGSYSNVVGLPACETLDLLLEAGVLQAWP
jgi:septum formation protein